MHSIQKNKAVTIVSLFSIGFGATVIFSWVFNIKGVESFFPGYVYMKFNSALCLVLFGFASVLIQYENKKYNKLFFLALSLALILIAALTLSQYIFHFNAGIDQLFIADNLAKIFKYPFPGRMFPQVAFAFVLYGLALLGFSFKNQLINNLSQYALHLVTVISTVAIIGYLYNFSFSYNLKTEGPMVLVGAFLFFFTSIITSLLHPSLGITGLFSGSLIGNKMARRLFILMAFIIVIFGLMRGQNLGFKLFSYDTSFSLLTICLLLVSLAIIWHTANWLNKIDLKRYEAEEEIKVMNEELEERVEERSAELFNLLEKYRESESKFRTAFEYSAIGMALVSLNGYWLKVNISLCEMVGYSENELLAKSFLDITHPDDVTLHIDVVDNALKSESGVSKFEKRYIHKNGSVVWASVNFATVKDDTGVPLYIITQLVDITERKKAENAQKLIIENEERLRAIFDNVEGAASLFDTEMRLIAFNRVFLEKQIMLTGKEPKIGDKLYESLTDNEKKQRYEIIERVLKGNKEAFEAVYERTGKNLYFRILFTPVIVDGKVTAISSYAIDLTASREAENKIRKADARFSSIVESVFVGIKLNDRDWNIIYRSPSMQVLNGWTDDEMKQRYLELVHPDDLENVKKVRRDVLLNPGISINIVYRILHKNGSYIWIESLICNKLSDPDLEAFITVTREITKRKLVEDKLKISEEKYRTLVEHASDAIYLVDYEGNFTDVNESMCKMTGYNKTELLKLNIEKLIDPEQLKTDPVKHGPMEPGIAVIRERRFVHKDGHIFDAEINVKQFADDYILVIARDITGRKQMENELREAELKFRTLAEKSMVGVYISQKERFIYVNPRFAEIFGYEPNEIINTKDSAVEIIISEEDRATVRNNIQARYRGGLEIVNYEVAGKKKDGTRNRIEFYGSRVLIDGEPSIIGTMLDVTERSNAEEILKRSEANLKSIMDTTDTVYILMDKNLNIMSFNQMAVKFVNEQFHLFPEKSELFVDYFTKEGFPQSLLDQLDDFHKGRLTQFKKNANKVLKGRTIRYEINYPQPDGSVCWYYARLFPITKDKNEIFGLMVELSDITERKNAEENLKTAYLRIQKHVDSIKEMAWKQSHLIRGPIANLKGLAIMLNENPSDDEVLKYIQAELERLDKVIIEMADDASNHEL